ncbi:MAG: hypothetical protein QM754_21745 [Tepidisphaeraceae bacterium]
MDCGLAGTVLRFVPPLAALSGVRRSVFDGDEQARTRPIAPLLDGTTQPRCRIDGDGLPFTVTGTGAVAGGTWPSTRRVLAVRIRPAALRGGIHRGPDRGAPGHGRCGVPSAPHIEMTVAMLRQAGVDVDDSVANRWRVRPGTGGVPALGSSNLTCPTRCRSWPPRSSPAARYGSPNWPAVSVQPARAILDVLTSWTPRSTTGCHPPGGQRGGEYQGFDVGPA